MHGPVVSVSQPLLEMPAGIAQARRREPDRREPEAEPLLPDCIPELRPLLSAVSRHAGQPTGADGPAAADRIDCCRFAGGPTDGPRGGTSWMRWAERPFCGPVGSRDLELPDSLGEVAVPDVTLAGRRIPGSGWFTECSARPWRCGSRSMLSAEHDRLCALPYSPGSGFGPIRRRRWALPLEAAQPADRPDLLVLDRADRQAVDAVLSGFGDAGSVRRRPGKGTPPSQCPALAAVRCEGAPSRLTPRSGFQLDVRDGGEAARLGRPEPRLCSWVTRVP